MLVIKPAERFLYLVQPNRTARRYGIGVGRQGFQWSGTAYVKRKEKWPAWRPPKTMLERRRTFRSSWKAAWKTPLEPGPCICIRCVFLKPRCSQRVVITALFAPPGPVTHAARTMKLSAL